MIRLLFEMFDYQGPPMSALLDLCIERSELAGCEVARLFVEPGTTASSRSVANG